MIRCNVGEIFWTKDDDLVTKSKSMHAYYNTPDGNVALCSNKIYITTLPTESQPPDKSVCRSCRKSLKKLKR